MLLLLRPHHANFRKCLVKSPKAYFLDTGLACFRPGLRSPSDVEAHPLQGSLFETLVVSEVYKAFAHRGERPPLFFWRDRTGHEVDIVVDLADGPVPHRGQAVEDGSLGRVSRTRSLRLPRRRAWWGSGARWRGHVSARNPCRAVLAGLLLRLARPRPPSDRPAEPRRADARGLGCLPPDLTARLPDYLKIRSVAYSKQRDRVPAAAPRSAAGVGPAWVAAAPEVPRRRCGPGTLGGRPSTPDRRSSRESPRRPAGSRAVTAPASASRTSSTCEPLSGLLQPSAVSRHPMRLRPDPDRDRAPRGPGRTSRACRRQGS